MERVRIADIAEELGVSTATVSNVIHGKTGKISDKTVKRVQALLEERAYIPSMAGILLAQNNSRIIGVIINDHAKYEGRALEDGFISGAVNALSREIDKNGYFMMIKVTACCSEIVRIASMWNMDGLVIMGFCEQDYQKLRESMHIPFVVYDGYFQAAEKICNLTIDNYDGGYQVGTYLKQKGHRRVLCISDNAICMDAERMDGCRAAMGTDGIHFLQIPLQKKERMAFYEEKWREMTAFTAIFSVSDVYAVELMRFLQAKGVRIPEEMSMVGFDDSPVCHHSNPSLTTVRQDVALRARDAITVLKGLKAGTEKRLTIKEPVYLIERDSVRDIT